MAGVTIPSEIIEKLSRYRESEIKVLLAFLWRVQAGEDHPRRLEGDIHHATGYSPSTIRRNLKQLENMGHIKIPE